MDRARRSLRTQLLAELVMLASAAVVLVGVVTALVAGADVGALAAPLTAFWVLSTVVLLVFGLHLLKRQVLQPLTRLAAEADALAAGRRVDAGTTYESAEFAELAARYRAMAASLLDAQGLVVRQEKLAGIGRLAAGVAHEVRNPLGAIGTYLEVLRQRGTDPAVLEDMRSAMDRIERIVASLLDYARPKPATGQCRLHQVTRDAVAFLESQGALRDRAIEVSITTTGPAVQGDQHALEQAVVNLVLNARDAARRRIVVTVEPHELPARMAAPARRDDDATLLRLRPVEARPGRAELPAGAPGVLLVVADDGPGVDEDDRERVFDPFFTTKDPGRGTGLGLAIVARTVHEAGGMVWVDRAREGGAAFKVFLPSAEMVRERCAS